MAANHKTAHFPNVRERRAKRLEDELSGNVAEKTATEPVEDLQSVEVEDEVGAQSEAEPSDSAETESKTDTQGFEKPLTFGKING